jgi:two-component system phosphate regulon response regulator PhoB
MKPSYRDTPWIMRDGAAPILVVDDEPDIRRLVSINLQRAGHRVVEAESGEAALACVQAERPALVILDLMLPGMDGREICRRLRADPATARIPVLMLTARSAESDRVGGFELGADDYVTKPFSVQELVLRVAALLRRAGPEQELPVRLEFPDLCIDSSAHRVWVEGEEVQLTVTEFRLLWVLASREGQAQSRGTLLEDVWDASPLLNTRTVDTHMKRLREKLGSAAASIETVRGVGYRFSP